MPHWSMIASSHLEANRSLPGRCLWFVPWNISNSGNDPTEPWSVVIALSRYWPHPCRHGSNLHSAPKGRQMLFVPKIIQSIQVQRHTKYERLKKTTYYSDSPVKNCLRNTISWTILSPLHVFMKISFDGPQLQETTDWGSWMSIIACSFS